LGHPIINQQVSCLGSITARQSSSGRQPNFAALNRGRHLCSAGRPTRWALACILVTYIFAVLLPHLSRPYAILSANVLENERDIMRINQSKSATTGADFRNGMVKRVKLRQRAKFRGNSPTIVEIMAIFRLFKMAVHSPLSWIFIFFNF